jgi:peptidoglycan/LPS O-acetylase OafA/YrhL
MNAKSAHLGYVPALDGLRGFAILAVILYHAQVPLFRGGFIGVDIFFVLSGFLITSLLVREFYSQHHIDLKNFYVRRVLRLGPALGVFLASFASLSLLMLGAEQARAHIIDTLIALFYFTNWSWAFHIHPSHFLAHTWSLAIEEQFYIIWPLLLIALLRLIRSHRNVIFAVILLLLSSWLTRIFLAVGGASLDRLYNGLDTRGDELLTGCLLGIVLSSNLMNEHRQHQLESVLKFIGPLSAISLIVCSIFMRWQSIYMYYYGGFLVIELSVSIIILDIFLSRKSLVNRILLMKPVVWIGRISYGLYLWHFLIFSTMRGLGFRRIDVITGGTCLAFLVASASYYFLERPVLKLKSRLTPHLSHHTITSEAALPPTAPHAV